MHRITNNNVFVYNIFIYLTCVLPAIFFSRTKKRKTRTFFFLCRRLARRKSLYAYFCLFAIAIERNGIDYYIEQHQFRCCLPLSRISLNLHRKERRKKHVEMRYVAALAHIRQKLNMYNIIALSSRKMGVNLTEMTINKKKKKEKWRKKTI